MQRKNQLTRQLLLDQSFCNFLPRLARGIGLDGCLMPLLLFAKFHKIFLALRPSGFSFGAWHLDILNFDFRYKRLVRHEGCDVDIKWSLRRGEVNLGDSSCGLGVLRHSHLDCSLVEMPA